MDDERHRDERRRKLVRARVRKHRELTFAAKRRRSSDSSSSSDELEVRRPPSGIRAIPNVNQNNLIPPNVQESAENYSSNEVLSSENHDNLHPPIENPILHRSHSQSSSGSDERENSSQNIEDNNVASSDWTADELSAEENPEMQEINESADSEESEEENENLTDMNRLREWAIKNKIQQNHLDELLTICRRRWLPDLPKSSKTFLRTSRATYNILPMECASGNAGEFVYFGVRKGLNACIDPNVHTDNTINLKFSVDGLPISKSDNTQLWPILCQVDHDQIQYEPFVVGMLCGTSKPVSNLVFFEEFCTEINLILANGLEIEGHEYIITTNCFVCDTPARAFCKNTAGQNGKYSCERCTVVGIKRGFSHTVYLSMDSAERTDQSFREQSEAGHHNGNCLLTNILPVINMIMIFVLDFMHLCCLGVMKRLLEYWHHGNINHRLHPRMRDELADRMELLKTQVPCEFQRKPRSTKKYTKWKATEFRFFLLYCGPIVLMRILPKRLYNHFLLLHTACRILCIDNLCVRLNGFAKEYLRAFVRGLVGIYGEESQTINAHHLLHLADDVISTSKNLMRISAFPFENCLGKLKSKLRSSFRPLAQLCRRLYEENTIVQQKGRIPPTLEILKERNNVISQVKYRDYTLTARDPDNTVLLENSNFLQIVNIFRNENEIQVQGYLYGKRKPIYVYPFQSDALDMWEVFRYPLETLHTFPITSIKSKVIKLSLRVQTQGEQRTFMVPFIH